MALVEIPMLRLLVRAILMAVAMVSATLVFAEEVLVTGLILSAVYAVTVSLVLGLQSGRGGGVAGSAIVRRGRENVRWARPPRSARSARPAS